MLLKVKITVSGLKDKVLAEDLLKKGAEIERKAIQAEAGILEIYKMSFCKYFVSVAEQLIIGNCS